MIGNLKDFLGNLFDSTDQDSEEELTHNLQLAAAALMFEVARSDNHLDLEEVAQIRSLLEGTFELSEEEISTLVDLASGEVEVATDLFQFTQLVNEHLEYKDKVSLIKQLWKVAYADGNLASYEDHMLRRISGLLHITHADFVRAKIEARPPDFDATIGH